MDERMKEVKEALTEQKTNGVCPDCGRCPTCGRRGWPTPLPPFVSIPYSPPYRPIGPYWSEWRITC